MNRSAPPTWETILIHIEDRLTTIEDRLAAIDVRQAADSARLQILNEWHAQVNGALWALSAIGGLGFAVGLVVLKTLLERL